MHRSYGLVALLAAACANSTAPVARSARWSFGEPGIDVELTIDGDDVEVRVVRPTAGHDGTIDGTLSLAGRAALDDATAELADAVLEPRYGCPDCDDGGAVTIRLHRDGTIASHAYQHGRAPPELAALDAVLDRIRDALERCATTTEVTPAARCVSSLPARR